MMLLLCLSFLCAEVKFSQHFLLKKNFSLNQQKEWEKILLKNKTID